MYLPLFSFLGRSYRWLGGERIKAGQTGNPQLSSLGSLSGLRELQQPRGGVPRLTPQPGQLQFCRGRWKDIVERVQSGNG